MIVVLHMKFFDAYLTFQGSVPPLKNHKNIGFSFNTGQNPLKNSNFY